MALDLGEEEHHIISYKKYFGVWLYLLAITLTSMIFVYVDFGGLGSTMMAQFALALVKSGILISFFMHLQFEKSGFRWFALLVLIIILIIFGLTASDVMFRESLESINQ